MVRSYFHQIPDGRYVGKGCMDDNGIESTLIPFEVALEVQGSNVRVDYSKVPDAQIGPVNCPLPSTVSASRIAISMLAGGSEAPTEGHFRPIEVITRPGSMFHPRSPSPCFLYGWPALQSMEVIYQAISRAMPELVPACSGGDICGSVWWGTRETTGEVWADGTPLPVGQGGHSSGDGSTCLHVAEAASRFAPTEVWESRNPWLINRIELAQDSCGAGEFRGGLGLDIEFEMLEETFVTTVVERTKLPPWGINKGKSARANNVMLKKVNGGEINIPKETGFKINKGEKITFITGGGGGYGDPKNRKQSSIKNDLKQEYLSREYVNEHYNFYIKD